jgi:hypothetical protein
LWVRLAAPRLRQTIDTSMLFLRRAEVSLRTKPQQHDVAAEYQAPT